MLASLFRTPGGPEVLELAEVPVPVPGPGEVLVRVLAAGVQPADAAVRRGWSPPGTTVELPAIPGNEFAGVVERLGPGSHGWSPGDEVLGFRLLGGHAQYVTAPADQLVAKPATMSWAEAGSLSASGQTAHVALTELGVGPGDTLLLHGASGGVGTVAVQLARHWGATVIGVASAPNHDHLRALGATPVAYGPGLADRIRAAAPTGVTAVLDAAGHGSLDASLDLGAPLDRIGTIVDYPAALRLGLRTLRGPRTATRLAELTDLHTAGALHLTIAATLPLSRAPEAHHLVEAGHTRGKLVLTPWPTG
ncbi:alcohol dehydrogenase [Kitasatospora sp. MMS16-BH015]|uniref:NADP-dependent oxidoreductase n=1 Tax=Kitasatospora sp. MMS16-BH015 TaxID=2018025 RepID=UPI000CA0C72D|nr:NADP-dependent oxidoreductase [Kitasatospora sp. MMS16-BH015]AUG77351.1 alcohol dehydrogenase [Kitasatospora sp. MMS16-BH015]